MSNSEIIESSWPPGQLERLLPAISGSRHNPSLSLSRPNASANHLPLARPLHARQNERRALLRTPVAIGDVMVGSTVSQVEISYHPDFAVGELVLSQSGWQDMPFPTEKDSSPRRAGGASLVCPGVLGCRDLPHTWLTGDRAASRRRYCRRCSRYWRGWVGCSQIAKLKGCHVVASLAARRNADLLLKTLASMPASTIGIPR